MAHWHVETGLTGYGPDAADRDGFAAYADVREVADAIRGELQAAAEMEHTDALSMAEDSRYREAWHTMRHADELLNLAANFDNNRAGAPLFVQPGGLSWDEALVEMIGTHSPVGIDPMTGPGADDLPEHESPHTGYRSAIYVWRCEYDTCPDYGGCMGPEEVCEHDDNG